jgi:outer membrane protein assembly factor BamA
MTSLLALTSGVFAQGTTTGSADSVSEGSLFISGEDGWPDISGFLDTDWGFVPIVSPISEPAVGYGAAAALTLIKKHPGVQRPDITAVGGLGTQNGTWGAFAADSRYWLNGRLQTFAAILTTSVNLDYYGTGSESQLANKPLSYALSPKGGVVQGKYRIGDSDLWAGLGYGYMSVEVAFDAPSNTAGLPDFQRKTNIGTLGPSLSYDTRDNIFTPNRGTYVEATATFASPALGGDSKFQRLQVVAMQFVPVPGNIFLGVRGQVMGAYGDPPFYVKPFILMRGIPAMRYQGNKVAQIETELRWQCWKRLSLVGFGGVGEAWNSINESQNEQTVVAGGAGLRYEIARRYGIHVGADAAFGPMAGPTIYIIVGSAWVRP